MPKSLTKILATLLLVVAINPIYAGHPNCSGSIATSNQCINVQAGSDAASCSGAVANCYNVYEYNSYNGKSYRCQSGGARLALDGSDTFGCFCKRDKGAQCNPVMCPSNKAENGCSAVSVGNCTNYYGNNSSYPSYVNTKCVLNQNGTACQDSTVGCNP